MRQEEKLHTILFASALFVTMLSAILGLTSFIIFIIRLIPFIALIGFSLFIKSLYKILLSKIRKPKKKDASESIFQKRLKRFKSIKRGYYSLIILAFLYILSLLGPIWMNNKPLFVSYANEKYEFGEKFTDLNGNGVWDDGEQFVDNNRFYFPAIRDFLSFIPGVSEARYSAQLFNQDGAVADFRKLNESIHQNNSNNLIVMPFYPYHPHEDLSDELDELFTDAKNGVWDDGEEYEDLNKNKKYDDGEPFTDALNGKWDDGERFVDGNNNNKYDTFNPPTKPGDSPRFLLGTETSGKDVFTRLVDGYKISITFAIIVTTLSYIIGVIIGAFLGYFGGRWDLFGVRLIEIFSSIPFLFVLMILSGFMKPNVYLLAILSVLLKGWIGITMYIRGEFFREKPKDYVSAAVSMGQSSPKIMFKHILPNSLTPIITFAPFSIIGDIFTLVSLDFLGYGLKPPTSSWGALLQQGSENLLEWHLLVAPIIVLTITIFMITFISEAIREAFDPRVYSRLR